MFLKRISLNFLILEEALMSKMFMSLTKRISLAGKLGSWCSLMALNLSFWKTLEDGPFVPLSNMSTSTNPLPKPQNQWLHAESRLANQHKTLKSIIIFCLPNDVIKSAIKCKTAKAMWNDLILAHKGPSDTRDTMIANLRLKFNVFKALKGEKTNRFTIQASSSKALISNLQMQDSDLNVEEDLRSSSGFIANLIDEYHERDSLANHKRFYKKVWKGWVCKEGKSEKGLIAKSFDWDEEYVSLEDERTTKVKTFMAIAEEDPSIRKADASLALGGRGKEKEKISSKEVIFTKADESSFVPIHEITSNSVSKYTTQESLPPLLKLIGAEPSSTSNSLIPLADLTRNMADLILNISFPKKTKPTSDKVSHIHVIKKKTKTKEPFVLESCFDKKANSSAEQLLLTLMKEVKGLKEQIKTPSGTSPSVSQSNSGYSRHMTGVKQYLHRYSKESGPTVVFGDNYSGDTEGYGSVNCNGITSTRHGKTAYDVFRERSPDISYFHVFGHPMHIHNHKDHLGKFDENDDDGLFLGYSLVEKSFSVFNIRIQKIKETYHVTFNKDDEAISQFSTEVDLEEQHGVVIKNKEKLLAQGYNQQEGIDYEETFSLVARLKAIRIFLAYATYMGFRVYQMNVKSAFLKEMISEEVYVQQPPGFKSSEFLN
nr:copia protein [Tanacetum cinerariifolium]